MFIKDRSLLTKGRWPWLLVFVFQLTILSLSHAQQWIVYTQTGTGEVVNFPFNYFLAGDRVAVDKDNAIWMTLTGSRTVRFSPASDQWDVVPSTLPDIFTDLESNIYFGSNGRISRYQDGSVVTIVEDGGNDYVVNSDHRIWFIPQDEEVRMYDGTVIAEFDLSMPGGGIALPTQLERDDSDFIWCTITNTGDASALVQVNGSVVYDNTHSDIFNYLIFSLDITEDNNIWVGTSPLDPVPGRGTAFLNRQTDTWTMYNRDNSMIPSDTIFHLKGDNQNRIWVSTHKGLARFDGADWVSFNTGNSPLPADSTISIAIDTVGTKWFATTKGLASFNEITPSYHVKHCGPSVTFTDQSESMDGDIVAWNWDFAGLGSSEQAEPTFTFPGPGSYQVTLWMKDEKGNRNITTRIVAVTERDETLFLGPDISVCTATAELTSNINDSDSHDWILPGGSTQSGNSIIAETSGQYILEISKTGCVQKDTIEVEVNRIPSQILDLGADIDSCEPIANITSNVTGADSYLWFFPDGITSDDPVASATASGTYRVEVTAEGCVQKDTIEVILNRIPSQILDLGGDISTCDATATISSNVTGADTYLWLLPGGGTSDEPAINVTVPGAYVVEINAENCLQKDTINVILNRVPSKLLSLGSDIVSCNATIPVSSNIMNAENYLWTLADETTSAQPSITANSSGRYVLRISFEECIQQDTIEVMLNVFTTGDFEMATAGTVIVDRGVMLTNVPMSFNNISATGENFSWNFGDGSLSSEDSPEHTYASPGEYTVTLVGNDDRDCPIIVEKVIDVKDIVITNAISPNGDGRNDKLYIEPLLYKAELKVINRWGRSVYGSADYQDDFTGSNLESGVYFYEVYFKAVDKRYKGYVHILK